MVHDIKLLDHLSKFPVSNFEGEAFRATPISLDPLTPSIRGGRWAPVNRMAVLNTSLERECALAEVTFHWGQLTPPPSKHALLHRIHLTSRKTLRLIESDIGALGIDRTDYESTNYDRTQEIGAAVAFLECDGLIAPSARWSSENLILFMDNYDIQNDLRLLESEEIDWKPWAIQHGFLDPENS